MSYFEDSTPITDSEIDSLRTDPKAPVFITTHRAVARFIADRNRIQELQAKVNRLEKEALDLTLAYLGADRG